MLVRIRMYVTIWNLCPALEIADNPIADNRIADIIAVQVNIIKVSEQSVDSKWLINVHI